MPTLETTQIVLKLLGRLKNPTDLSLNGGVIDELLKDYTKTFGDGTGANQAKDWFHDQRTLTASATENLDLAAGLTDPFGASITFTKVRAIIVVAAVGNTNDVQVTRPAANGVPIFLAAGDGVPVVPGGVFIFIAPNANGIAVTAGTGDLLTFTNSAGGTSVTYDVFILGTT